MRTSKHQGSKTEQHKESEHNPGGSPNTSATHGAREDRSRNADMGVGDGQEDEKDTIDTDPDRETGEPKPAERKRPQPRPPAGGHRAQ
jgi:hypothetical protein